MVEEIPKMYVWENVLQDYTPGLACVIATSIDQALHFIKQKAQSAPWAKLTKEGEFVFDWQRLLGEICDLKIEVEKVTDLGAWMEEGREEWRAKLELLDLRTIKESLRIQPKIITYGGAIVSGGG